MGGAVPRINRFSWVETYERFDVGLRWRNNELLRQRMTGAQHYSSLCSQSELHCCAAKQFIFSPIFPYSTTT